MSAGCSKTGSNKKEDASLQGCEAPPSGGEEAARHLENLEVDKNSRGGLNAKKDPARFGSAGLELITVQGLPPSRHSAGVVDTGRGLTWVLAQQMLV
jgi:hypothetical protein